MKQAASGPSPKRTAASTNGLSSDTSKTRADHEFPVISKRSSPKRARKAISSSTQRDVSLPRVNSATYSGATVPVADTGEELEILKCILVREGYLQRLAHASTGGKVAGSHLGDTIDLLDLLRVASIDVVEAISNWRRKLQTQEPYRWNQLNYLLKMPSDLDFLQKHQALIQWLGFTLERNPFILPLNLDGRALQNGGSAAAGDRYHHKPRSNLREDSSSFVQIGGKRQIDRSELDRPTTSQRAAKEAALAERKRAKNPYETRVLNDEELIPIASLAAAPPTTAESSRSRPVSTSSRKSFVLTSQIGDLDMERIQSAEMAILHEESVFGLYTRDIQGRVVPADEAQRQLDMIGMSGNAYRSSQPRQTQPEQTPARDESDSPRNDSLLTNPSALPGKAYAKKRAGMLGPIAKPMRRPARQPPGRRSRGAHLEEVLVQDRQATIQLGLRIDSLREEIERKEMDVAYFESFPGLQHYGNELSEFVHKARQEITHLRKDLQEKEYIYHQKMTNIDKKQEIIHVFKEKNKSAIEHNYSAQIQANVERATMVNAAPDIHNTFDQVSDRRRQELQAQKSNQEHQEQEHLRTAPIVHSLCATLIQKIARGMIARAAFASMKIEFYVSSKYIQAAVRGFLTRRRVAKMFWHDAASRIIQRHTRGMIARGLVMAKRRCERVYRATILLQKVVRGHFGRVRMKKVRRLFHAREELLHSVMDLRAEDFKDLAIECLAMVSIPSLTFAGPALPRKPLTSLVLGLVRILMLFTSDDDNHVDVANIRWREASRFLTSGMRLLRRMKQIAIAAEGRYLRLSALGNLLVQTYSADRAFKLHTFERLERCWKGASAIYKWIMAFATVTSLQSLLPAFNLANEGPLMIEAETGAVEAKQDQTEEHENAITEEEIERRFVPAELTQVASYPHHRRRPVVLLFAYDLPQQAKQRMLDSTLALLPGLFIVLNRHATNAAIARTKREKDNEWGWDFAALHRVIALGYSVVLECDIGLSDPQQRRFIGRFAAVKAAIKPSPLCILVRGSIKNRSAQDNEDDLSSPQKADYEASSHNQRVMADVVIKRSFEQAADALYRLENEALTTQMQQLSSMETPPTAPMIIVMEAVIILLTPSKRYEGPRQSTSAVSWKLAKRLLSNPAFLLTKLHSIEHTDITLENLTALDRYLKHQDWPSRAVAHSSGKSSRLLFALACWVEAMSSSAHLVRNCNGLACEITRTAPLSGLFGSVITYTNTSRLIAGRSEEECALMELMDAILLDVRVYRKSQPFDGRHYVVSVYHDCLHIYFSVYDPNTSFRWQSVISESDVNRLLSPNSLERGNIKLPPKTKDEMYDRLVKLCLLQDKPLNGSISTGVKSRQSQQMRSSSVSDSSATLFTKQLIVRPRAVRLYRRTLALNGYFVTLTMSELSRGRIEIDTFIHNSSGASPELRSVVNIESILQRLSAQGAKDVFVALDKIPYMILDRLHLYRPMQSRLPRDKAVRSQHSMLVDERLDMNLRVRSKPTSRGRCLLRTAVRSPWLSAIWMCCVFEHHVTRDYRLELYQPQTCESFSIRLSRRDIQEFGRVTRLASCRPALFQRLIKHFVLQLDAENGAIETCSTRRILARFPCAIPVAENAHQMVTKRKVVRARVQVERQVDGENGSSEGLLCFRITLPETSEEQTLQLHDRELETCFTTVSWATATTETRRELSREFARTYLRWHSDSGRVAAALPWGSMEATLSTRNTGYSPSKKHTHTELNNRRSVGSLRGSVAILWPCTRLLDAHSAHQLASPCYIYDTEELIHNGSHRANGVSIITQVYMKAVVLETLVPRMPTDRVQQSDSFVMRLEIYEPKSSAHATVFINGRNDLREIVGPDHASLIASDQVHALLAYIFASRTDVLVPAAGAPRQLSVTFLRDRLYAKQKATPINEHMKIDQATNATKLIDQVEIRGVKVSSRVRSVPSFGSVIFTVFDLGLYNEHSQRSPEHSGIVRVDAYVRKTSARLSLVLDKADLLLIAGEHVKLLEKPTAYDNDDDDGARLKQLAALVIDHCAIETWQDGSPDRLYLTDHFAPEQNDSRTKTDQHVGTQGKLSFKTLRTVGHDPVMVSLYSLEERESIEIRFYDPSTSARSSLVLDKPTLALVFGLDELAFRLEQLRQPTVSPAVVFSHALSFVRIEKIERDPLCGEEESLHATLLTGALALDQDQAITSRDRMNAHAGQASEYESHSQSLVSWQGMGTTEDRTYCVIRWDLFARSNDSQAEGSGPWSYQMLCSVHIPRLASVVTRAFGMADLTALSADIPWLAIDSLQVAQQIHSRLHVHVAVQDPEQVGIITLSITPAVIEPRIATIR